MPDIVLDASGLVEVLLRSALGQRVAHRLRDLTLHAPAHLDAEVFSALGRMFRAGEINEQAVTGRLQQMIDEPIERHPVPPLVFGAWTRRHNISLMDALYIELASQLGTSVITTDARLAAATPLAELVS